MGSGSRERRDGDPNNLRVAGRVFTAVLAPSGRQDRSRFGYLAG